MSTTPFRKGPCTAPPFPPRACCASPQTPWPAHIPLAPAVDRGQWRRTTDGTGRFCHVLSVGSWEREGSSDRCEVELYDTDGRAVTNVRGVWSIAILYGEILAAVPRIYEVMSGEYRRTEGGIIVEVTSRDGFGEYRLRALEGATEEETTQIEGRTYGPREVVKLYPDKLSRIEVLESESRMRTRDEERGLARRRVVMGGGRGVALVAMAAMLAIGSSGRER